MKVEKLASSIFSREKLRARELSGSKLLDGEPRCFIGNRAIYGAEDARQPPSPLPLLILAARR